MSVTITSLYRQLFGKRDPVEGDVISMSEHGRAGGLSTGHGYKTTKNAEELTYVDQASSTITYLGYAKYGTATSADSWQIKKILVAGAITSIAYADGDDNYDNIWDNRGSLTYS